MGEEVQHAPVMLKEAIEFLAPQEGGTYVDCTLGSGGHAREILSLIGPTGRLIGFDKDEAALNRSKEVLAPYLEQVAVPWQSLWDMAHLQGLVQGPSPLKAVLRLAYSCH